MCRTTTRVLHTYYEQGDPADAFFIVLKGKIEVVIDEEQLTVPTQTEDTPRRATSRPRSEAENKAGGLTKGYGETFGVASLVLDAPVRQYGMRTTERCLFIRIAFDDFRPTPYSLSPNPNPNPNPYANPGPNSNDFRPFLAHNPALEVSLLYTTKLFLLQRYSTMPSSIFSAFNAEELKVATYPFTPPIHRLPLHTPFTHPSHALTTPYKVASSVATFHPLATGQTLYAVGDEPTDFWVVAHGEVMCDYCDGSTPTTLKVGSYFGEVRSKSTWVRECVSTRVSSTVR